MRDDAARMRGERPFVFSNLKTGQGLDQIIDFIVEYGMLQERLPGSVLVSMMAGVTAAGAGFPRADA
jgi:hypothetical protein